MIKQSLVILALAISTGCAVQPSTYENRTTAEGDNVITATGAASVEAAKKHGSYNCINCEHIFRGAEAMNDSGRYSTARKNPPNYRGTSHTAKNGYFSRYFDDVKHSTQAKTKYKLNRKVSKEVDRFLDKMGL